MLSYQSLYDLLNKSIIKKAIFALFTIIVAFISYSSWKEHVECKAHSALTELFERYEAAAKIGSEITINEIISDSEIAYKKYSCSDLSPYFLICQANAFLLLNNYEQSRALLTKACLLLDSKKKNPLNVFYKISLANCMINHGEEKDITEALNILRACSSERTNPFHEMAIYFHGLYMFNNVGLAEADDIWSPLMKDPIYQTSVWKEKVTDIRNGF